MLQFCSLESRLQGLLPPHTTSSSSPPSVSSAPSSPSSSATLVAPTPILPTMSTASPAAVLTAAAALIPPPPPHPTTLEEHLQHLQQGTPGGGADMAAWSGAALPPTAGYYPYDHPTLAAYGYGGGYDLAARRKNATRESTATLKAWLNEHKKNPYPTKGEKIMLAIITKMTLTQVSTWFANARRRLKKENKMTWEPKNKLDDEDVDVSDDDEKDDIKHGDLDMLPHHGMSSHGVHHLDSSKDHDSSKAGIPIPPSKPKIWSLADTAVCKTPPPANPLHGGGGQHQMQHNQHLGMNHWSASAQGGTPGQHLGFGGMLRAGNMFGAMAAQLPSPSVASNEQSADTPPHTPPNKPNNGNMAGLAGLMGAGGMFNGYNGLHNGYGGSGGATNAATSGANMMNTAGSFKMM